MISRFYAHSETGSELSSLSDGSPFGGLLAARIRCYEIKHTNSCRAKGHDFSPTRATVVTRDGQYQAQPRSIAQRHCTSAELLLSFEVRDSDLGKARSVRNDERHVDQLGKGLREKGLPRSGGPDDHHVRLVKNNRLHFEPV